MEKNFYKRLTFKHTFLTIIIVFTTGTVFSLFQLIYDISSSKKRVKNNIEKMVEITHDSAAQSLYHLDKAQAKKLLEGYTKYPPVIYASITDNFGLNLAATNSCEKTLQQSFIYGMFSHKKQDFNFNLDYSAENIESIIVGNLLLKVDYSRAYDAFVEKAKFSLINSIIMHIFLAVIIAIIFFHNLTKPLLKLSHDISKIDLNNQHEQELDIPSVHKDDEMGQLISSINDILFKYSLLNMKLEQRVYERTLKLHNSNKKLTNSLLQLEQTKDKLIEAEKMASLGELVAGISHEINTPVGNSLLSSSFLSRELSLLIKKIDNENFTKEDFYKFSLKANESLDIITFNLQRAAGLVNDIKKAASNQSYLNMRVFSLKKNIEDTVSSLKPKIVQKNLCININCPDKTYIFHDPGIFCQIITNLIDNSITHGFDNQNSGIIDIEVTTDNKNILLKYMDNGKGINPSKTKKIFEPFFTTAKSKGGTGLGMYIIYNLVSQQLKGTISCANNTPEKGIVFYINFPFPKE